MLRTLDVKGTTFRERLKINVPTDGMINTRISDYAIFVGISHGNSLRRNSKDSREDNAIIEPRKISVLTCIRVGWIKLARKRFQINICVL